MENKLRKDLVMGISILSFTNGPYKIVPFLNLARSSCISNVTAYDDTKYVKITAELF